MSSMTMTSVTMSMRSCCWSSTEVSAPSSWVWSVQPWPGLSSSTTLSTVTSWSSNLHKSNIHFYLDVPGVDLSWWGAVSGLGRRRNTLHINTLHLHLLLVLHPPVLEPDLDLSLCQVQHRRHLNASKQVKEVIKLNILTMLREEMCGQLHLSVTTKLMSHCCPPLSD